MLSTCCQKLRNLSISAKLLIMMIVMLFVMLVMGSMVIHSELKQINKLEQEQSGLFALDQHLNLLKQVNLWRRLISGDRAEADRQAELIAELIVKMRGHSAYRDLGFDPVMAVLPTQWQEVSQTATRLTAFVSASTFMEQLTQDILEIGEHSQLVYDDTRSLALALRILLNHIPSIGDEYGKLHYLSRSAMTRKKTLEPEISAMKSALSMINKRMLELTQLAMQQSVIRDPVLSVSMMQLADQHSVFQFQIKSMIDQDFEEIDAEKLHTDFMHVTRLADQINQGLMAEIQYALHQEKSLAQISLVAIAIVLLIMIVSVLWFYWRFIYLQQKQALHAERVHTIGLMSASVAHEINNPVAGIMVNLQYLQEIVDPRLTEQVEILDECVTELNRVGKMVQDLLNFSCTDQPSEIVHTDHGLINLKKDETDDHSKIPKTNDNTV